MQSTHFMYLISPCLTLKIIRYGSSVKWVIPGKGVAPSPTPYGKSGLGTDVKKGVLRISQSSSITGTSSFDCLSRTLVGGWRFYPSTRVQSVYSTAPADWTKHGVIYHGWVPSVDQLGILRYFLYLKTFICGLMNE